MAACGNLNGRLQTPLRKRGKAGKKKNLHEGWGDQKWAAISEKGKCSEYHIILEILKREALRKWKARLYLAGWRLRIGCDDP
jgi:hypothetical protein